MAKRSEGVCKDLGMFRWQGEKTGCCYLMDTNRMIFSKQQT